MSYRILVTGSREWTDQPRLYKALWEVTFNAWLQAPLDLIHGKAPGADTLAEYVWNEWRSTWPGVLREPTGIEADWARYGKRAGPIRNAELIRCQPHICLAFPTRTSRGTWDCVDKAKAAGIPVLITSEETS